MGTGSFPAVKRPGRDADNKPPSSAEVKKYLSYTSTHPMGSPGPVTGSLYPILFYIVIRCNMIIQKWVPEYLLY